MICSKIAEFVVVLAVLLLVGTACGQDWLEGGYVRSFDRSMFMDPGIAGMVRWLDAPVDSYPWYSSDVKFYKQQVPDTTFSPYKEYFTTTGASSHWRDNKQSISLRYHEEGAFERILWLRPGVAILSVRLSFAHQIQ